MCFHFTSVLLSPLTSQDRVASLDTSKGPVGLTETETETEGDEMSS